MSESKKPIVVQGSFWSSYGHSPKRLVHVVIADDFGVVIWPGPRDGQPFH